MKRLLFVWLGLSLLTLVYLGMDYAVVRPSVVVTVIAIGIALVKVRFVFREFMEVRHAPVLLGRLADLWVVIIGVSLLGSYFIGMAQN